MTVVLYLFDALLFNLLYTYQYNWTSLKPVHIDRAQSFVVIR